MEYKKIEYTEEVEVFLKNCLHNEIENIKEAEEKTGNDCTFMAKDILMFLETHIKIIEFKKEKILKEKALSKLTYEEKELLGLKEFSE